MPELSPPKARPHPWQHAHRNCDRDGLGPHSAASISVYAELQVTTNFTFLTGASHPDEYTQQAAALGYTSIAVTDTHTLAGIVRAHIGAKDAGIALIVGCRLVLARGQQSASPKVPLLVYPTNRGSYGRLCQLLTLGKQRSAKGNCQLFLSDLSAFSDDLLAVIVPPMTLDNDFSQIVASLKHIFNDDRLSIGCSCLYRGDDHRHLDQLAALGEHVEVPLVATNDVHYHVPQRRALQDVLSCIRCNCTIHEAGLRRFAHAERYLKSPNEMVRLFAEYPRAVQRTIEIAQRATEFSLDELKYEYPDEICPPGQTAISYLIELTKAGAANRYPQGVPEKVRQQIEHELSLIDELKYASYFLTVYDLVKFARSQDILCQGRGAAANSAVCYCLGVTAVDPNRIDLLFERFVSRERNEPPDIDIDFEHERREEVIQYIYRKYGRDRAALTAEVITYRGRSAVREVGKALGLSLDLVERLAKDVKGGGKGTIHSDDLRGLGLSPQGDPTLHNLAHLTRQILGFPRHLSQHVGGFVMTRGRLCELVPIENAAMDDRTVIEWDKEDVDAMGMLKVDVLGLGMLTCIRKSFELIERHHGMRLTLANVPDEDPDVYDMICRADTIGVFQIESRAQMSMLPRLQPRRYYDLVIEVAIVRPGPIQGDMVHPYLRRRNGKENIEYPNLQVERILKKTLGVPLFQEQAMQLAVVAAGFTPGEADHLRRAIAAWKSKEKVIFRFGEKLIKGMIANGYERDFAHRCFEQIKGFSEYGFPESHAASFALLVYVSAWLKCHWPAEFACGLVNSQPMGFYAPAQIVRDAKEHGVQVREVDVNHSEWDCTIEEGGRELRLGMRLVKHLRQEDAQAITSARRHHVRFNTIDQIWRASRVRATALRALAAADAFGSMELDRQHALWHIHNLHDNQSTLFDPFGPPDLKDGAKPMHDTVSLPTILPLQQVIRDYGSVGLSLKMHPISFLRNRLTALGATAADQLKNERQWPNGASIIVAGVVLIRQRPGTASGVVFITLEDETGIVNLILRPHVFGRYRRVAWHATCMLARGRVERQGQVVHVMAMDLKTMDYEMQNLSQKTRDFR